MDKPGYKNIPEPMRTQDVSHQEVRREREVIVIGGGLAGLSAAIYLGRALLDVLVIDSGESLALWEPEVQNYLGFPDCIAGSELLKLGRRQAERYGAEFIHEEVEKAWHENGRFRLRAKKVEFECNRLLLATGVYHLPPKIPAVNECIGKSIFFCKDCDGYRVRGKRVVIAGHNNEAVEYALGMLVYTECVTLLTNGEVPSWDNEHERRLREYHLPVWVEKITRVEHKQGCITGLSIENGAHILADCIFTTRGDVYHNDLARQLGAKVDDAGQLIVDKHQRTSLPGLYAAGCVTPANCQMIIAAGDGAAAAQAIDREIFEESVRNGRLLQHRQGQLERGGTRPPVLRQYVHN